MNPFFEADLKNKIIVVVLAFLFVSVLKLSAFVEEPAIKEAIPVTKGRVAIDQKLLQKLYRAFVGSDYKLPAATRSENFSSLPALPIEMLSLNEDGTGFSAMRTKVPLQRSASIDQAVRAFISKYSGLFNLPEDIEKSQFRLGLKSFNKLGNFYHLRYQLEFGDIPVHEGICEFHVGQDLTIRLINGNFPSIAAVENSKQITRFQAIGSARKFLGGKGFRTEPDAELRLFAPSEGQARFVYIVQLPLSEPLGDWEVMVDAENAEILNFQNQMFFFSTGQGSVYHTNPLKSEAAVEPLPWLTHFNLRGKYVLVRNDLGTDSYSESFRHVYEPDSEHFDESNIYFHLNRVQDLFEKLGHAKPTEPVRAIVNLFGSPDNAYFSPLQKVLAFGGGEKLNDLSREAAVVYHEYSHYVLHSIIKLNYSKEAGAINEGQADYFACSFTDDPHIGEWVVAPKKEAYLRNLDNQLMYPDDLTGKVHHDGKIWGGTLWDLRKALGAQVADQIIYRSHHFLKTRKANFMDGFNAIILADEDLFAGKNHDLIGRVFSLRGINAKNTQGSTLDQDSLKLMLKNLEVHDDL